MAPKRTQTGASATTRRSTAKAGARASSSPRTRATSAPAAKSSTKRASASSAKSAPSKKRPAATRGPVFSAGSWWLAPAAIAMALVVFAWLYYPVVRVQYRETRERARLERELDSLVARNDRLHDEVERLKTPEGVEDYARSELGLVKTGEKAVVVVDADSDAETTGTPDVDGVRSGDQPVGPWTAFLDLVFGVR